MQMGSLRGRLWCAIARVRRQGHGALLRRMIAVAPQALHGGERGAMLAGIGATAAAATVALKQLLILHGVAHQHFGSAATGEDNLFVNVAHVAARTLQNATLGRLWRHRRQKSILSA